MENIRYERSYLLDKGLHGEVYKVVNSSTGEECVMKKINTKKTDQAVFQNEVALMKKINILSSLYLVKYITSYVEKKNLNM